ncbi:DNA-3-methyladenine glycosylase family protein [Oryzomonas japonica]|nr:DNA-3-methyladenine glycosylase 2 family protein [Oryzomonas japonica]
MRKLIGAHDPPRIGQNPVFFSLVRAVISQQLSEAAASTIFKRLCAIAEITPDALIALDLESIRKCGISSSKVGYIKGISQAALDGTLNDIETLSDDEAIKAMVKLKGVGRWTAEMILIFALGREDVWPCDDAGLLRSANRLYGIQGVSEFMALGERFIPFRTHAAWYLWSILDSK